MEVVTQCPACGGAQFSHFLDCTDFLVSHETFTIIQCIACKLCATSPRPSSQVISRYYKSDEYLSHSGKSKGIIGTIYPLARTFTLNWKLSLIEKYKTKGRILDFGCGTGEFLKKLGMNGWKIAGVEPDSSARKKAEEILTQPICSSPEEIADSAFDVITLWHVLEHVPNVRDIIDKLRLLLKKDGILIIALPNYESPDAIRYSNYWAGYDVPRHLWHFTKESIALLLANNSLRQMEIKPMILDSFYVSMLSEKYMKGPGIMPALSGLITGLRSNLAGAKKMNYSSLIYIATHL